MALWFIKSEARFPGGIFPFGNRAELPFRLSSCSDRAEIDRNSPSQYGVFSSRPTAYVIGSKSPSGAVISLGATESGLSKSSRSDSDCSIIL